MTMGSIRDLLINNGRFKPLPPICPRIPPNSPVTSGSVASDPARKEDIPVMRIIPPNSDERNGIIPEISIDRNAFPFKLEQENGIPTISSERTVYPSNENAEETFPNIFVHKNISSTTGGHKDSIPAISVQRSESPCDTDARLVSSSGLYEEGKHGRRQDCLTVSRASSSDDSTISVRSLLTPGRSVSPIRPSSRRSSSRRSFSTQKQLTDPKDSRLLDPRADDRGRPKSPRYAGRLLSEAFVTGLISQEKFLKLDQIAKRRISDPGKQRKVRRFSDLMRSGGGLTSIAKWRAKSKAKPRIPPLARFRAYARLTLICIRLCKHSHANLEAVKGEFLSVIQVTQDYVPIGMATDGAFFDPNFYRADKEERLPQEARKILQTDQRYRSEKDIQYLQIVLRSIKAFTEYPTRMQKRLCEVGWYEAYEPKRAIVRQGAPPHAFYFILSGSVVVTTFDSAAGGTKYLVSLHRGMSFGELAVINRARRQATVSTQTSTEFLCISARDFEEIFMAGGIKSVTDPDHNSFIRSIPFLKHWPVELLATNPQSCMFHFFARGQVLVRDSHHSDWLYIVKSGSLSVLKKLKEVHPTTKTDDSSDYDNNDESLEDSNIKKKLLKSFGTWDHRIRRRKRPAQRQTEMALYRNHIELDKRLEQTLPGYMNASDRLGIIDYDEIINKHKARVVRRMSMANVASSVSDSLPKLNEKLDEESQDNDSAKDERSQEDKAFKLPKIRKTSKLHIAWGDNKPEGVYLAPSQQKRKQSRKEDVQSELFRKQLEYDKKVRESKSMTVGRKTIANELDNKPIKDILLTEADLRPMFVLVQVLERGQYFGVSQIVYTEQPSFSVVSNGAECIMISRKFFLEKASEKTLQHLRIVESVLPGEEELQSNLQDFVNWKAHRAKIYNRLAEAKMSRDYRKHQFPTQFKGEYCFRTGPV